MKQEEQFMSLYDYLGHAAGVKLGGEVFQAAKAKNQPDPDKIFTWPADHIVYKYNPEDLVGIGNVIPAGPNAGKIKLGQGKYGESMPAEKPE